LLRFVDFMAGIKHQALQIFERTLRAIDIPGSMRRKLARSGSTIQVNGAPLDLASYGRIFAVAVGKASVAMASGLKDLLAPDFRAEGILVGPTAPAEKLGGFRAIVAGHPVPNQGSLEAGRAILDLLALADERTLIFFLLSGGGSALMEQPLDPAIGLDDLQALYRLLVTCGAPINEINAVRKHLSAVKGGRLAAAAPAAMKVTLGVTDVPEGCESALGSGPTLPDPTTVSDACRVIERYALLEKLPAKIRARFERPENLAETPKLDDPVFRRAVFQLLLGRHDLFHPAHCAAEAAGYVTVCDNSTDDWPLDRAADYLLEQLAELKREHPGRPAAVIADGEVSCPAKDTGIGGRNSAFVLYCVPKIAGTRIAVMSAGTDGIDGSSPAAGAVADGETLLRARERRLDPADYFERSDSYTFFDKLGDAIVTGPTGNNLRDLRILLSA
jgi:glycerate 2-kinase